MLRAAQSAWQPIPPKSPFLIHRVRYWVAFYVRFHSRPLNLILQIAARVAQAMATAETSSSRTRARSPGKSEAQVLICEMKTEIDATLMEVC